MTAFLSGDWFADARRLTADAAASPGSTCRLQFEAGSTRWYLVVEDGKVTDWQPGDIDAPDAELRWPSADDARRIFTRQLRGNDAMMATTVRVRLDDGVYEGPPSPMGLAERPELRDMPHIPDATYTALYRFTDGPFGDVHYVMRFEGGHLVEESMRRHDDPDVTVTVTYRAMAEVRNDEIDILTAIATGDIEGKVGPMALLAGIQETPEYHDAQIATGRYSLALATLGELDAHESFGPVVAELAANAE